MNNQQWHWRQAGWPVFMVTVTRPDGVRSYTGFRATRVGAKQHRDDLAETWTGEAEAWERVALPEDEDADDFGGPECWKLIRSEVMA